MASRGRLSQAEGLTDQLEKRSEHIAAVIEIEVPRDELIERLSGRRICPTCGTVYHIKFNPPKVAGICDKDGTPLIQREDDTPEAIARRLNLYFEMTAPVLAYYRNLGLLETVDGRKSIDEVQADIRAIVEARVASTRQ